MSLINTDENEINEYVTGFGRRFLHADVLEKFPETKIIPQYIREHFAKAEVVLDLGFGTGIWFWASFLPALKRIDGFDLYQQSLDEVDRVLNLKEIPEGYKVAHTFINDQFTEEEWEKLRQKKGNLIVSDYRQRWDDAISQNQYDLVTEYGGIGEVDTNQEFIEIIKQSGRVLKPHGHMMFMNFLEKKAKVGELEKKLGRYTPDSLQLSTELFHKAVKEADMKMIDFHAIENPEGMPITQTFFYGFVEK